MSDSINRSFLQNLRRLSFIEGISTLVLFGIAMPLKYAADMPMAVSVVGSLHGILFVALTFMLMAAINRVPLPAGKAIMGIFAAIIPFGPFIYDRQLKALEGTAGGSDSEATV